MSTLESLEFIKGRLQKLMDEDRVRYEGAGVMSEARQEVDFAIANYVAQAAVPAPIIYQVMTGEQVAAVVDSANARASVTERVIEDALGRASLGVVTTIQGQIETSDVSLMAAIVETRGDLLAAIQAPA
jgi:hypothetical protein